MTPKLYWIQASPPSRAVVFCARELGIDLEFIEVNLMKSEQHKPEFLKVNPLHSIPVLDDDGFIVIDSHAIMPYLVGKYGKGSSLYPQDIKKKAVVDQRLYFDCGTLFAIHMKICFPVLYKGAKTIPQEHLEALNDAYGCLEVFLQDSKYVAGDELTIADFSIWTTITNTTAYLPVDEKRYPNITSWLQRMQQTPYNELNTAGGKNIRALFKSIGI